MARIYYFTSTGNSLYVAKEIGGRISAELVNMALISEREAVNDEVLGFVFPVYFLGLPITVETFFKKLKIRAKAPYIFCVTTYGGMALGVGGLVDKILRRKHYRLDYYAHIKHVENYLYGYKVNNDRSVHEKAKKRTGKIVENIVSGKKNSPGHYTLLNRVVHSHYPALKYPSPDSSFIVDDCVACGICERVCPMNNIRVNEYTPVFLGNCELCLACVHACPNKAISYKKSMKDKARYRNPNVSITELELRSPG